MLEAKTKRRNGAAALDLETMKAQAKRLRAALNEGGMHVANHSLCLELVARMHGHKNWNVAQAAAPPKDAPRHVEKTRTFAPGDRVRGRYMSRAFKGVVRGAHCFAPGRIKIVVRFDEAVDACGFPGVSTLRRQVSVCVDENGMTVERTSDGVPHMAVELA